MPMYICQKGVGEGGREVVKYPSPPYSDFNEYQCCEYSNLNGWKLLRPPSLPRLQVYRLDT